MKTLYQLLGEPDFLFDSHCHLNSKSYTEDIGKAIQDAQGQLVEEIIDIGTDVESSERAIVNARKYETVTACVGIDPEVFIPSSDDFVGFDDAEKRIAEFAKSLELMIVENREFIKMIGESGMDYYWVNKADEITEGAKANSIKLQKQLFIEHLKIAENQQIPLSIHSRGAERECLEIVKKYDIVGIFHSYTGDFETAKEILKAGWALGINGIVTFKNAPEIRELYKKLLAFRNITSLSSVSELYKAGFYFETDGPFLSPEGKRGVRNSPANVREIYDFFVKTMFSS